MSSLMHSRQEDTDRKRGRKEGLGKSKQGELDRESKSSA